MKASANILYLDNRKGAHIVGCQGSHNRGDRPKELHRSRRNAPNVSLKGNDTGHGSDVRCNDSKAGDE